MNGEKRFKWGERQKEGEVKEMKCSDWLVVHLSDEVHLPPWHTAARTAGYICCSLISEKMHQIQSSSLGYSL